MFYQSGHPIAVRFAPTGNVKQEKYGLETVGKRYTKQYNNNGPETARGVAAA
jgi:hypothetical protein